MEFIPIKKMMDRVRHFGNDSDSVLFNELLYAVEFVTRLTAAAMVALVQDDRETHRYRLIHGLVRADGLGEWVSALDDVLTGPASQHLVENAKIIRRVFTERVAKGSWQYDATYEIRGIIRELNPNAASVGEKVNLREWFSSFAELRNKTRGHGAVTPAMCARLAPRLLSTINTIVHENPVFNHPWAYLHRNLSGKYFVVPLGNDQSPFSILKTGAALGGENIPDGVYIFCGGLKKVGLLFSDLDATDFFFPNGAFNGKRFELHSLLTDNRQDGDASPYLAVPSNRPQSETHSTEKLEVIGNVFTNMPVPAREYVRRFQLEDEIKEAILNDRHPIITLVGRGGIGKTSLALRVPRDVSYIDRYELIIWFSARDIDLAISGPKVVQPQVLTDKDIASEFLALIGEKASQSPVSQMADHLRSSKLGRVLFVFDNFETVRNPVDLFQWIDTNIRLPNKAVITSRFRDFKADYPIQISGMVHTESAELVDQMAARLGVNSIVTEKYKTQVIEEADGHPYVIKIILGELASTKILAKPKALIARKDEILEVLFERTFNALSPMAARIFMILSGWRSLVPQIAVEAVMYRHAGTEFVNPEGAINDLLRMSLIERVSAADNSDFLVMPLTAALFGLKKLAVSPARTMIDADIKFLQEIGHTGSGNLKDGLQPRIQALFKQTARRVESKQTTLVD